jgi:hypothetical protein
MLPGWGLMRDVGGGLRGRFLQSAEENNNRGVVVMIIIIIIIRVRRRMLVMFQRVVGEDEGAWCNSCRAHEGNDGRIN